MSETANKNKLTVLDLQSDLFTANGKTYYIEKNISVNRYRYYVMYQAELGYGITFADMLEKWKSVWEDAQKLHFASIVITSKEVIDGIAKFSERSHPAVCLCALFCNTEDEDRKTITAQMIEQKIADFEAEGIDMFSFFALAALLVSGLTDAWKDILSTDDLPVEIPDVKK